MARGTKINTGKGSVGDIMASMLDLAQFQAENGTDWVLADGTTAGVTKYNTITGQANLPDLRGIVLRGKDNGRAGGDNLGNPDGDVALGVFQDHEHVSHDHGGGVHSHSLNMSQVISTTATKVMSGTSTAASGSETTNDSATIIALNGGNETRMRNVTVNHFYKS